MDWLYDHWYLLNDQSAQAMFAAGCILMGLWLFVRAQMSRKRSARQNESRARMERNRREV